MEFRRSQGVKPNRQTKVWQNIQRLVKHMHTLETANSQLGKTISPKYYQQASLQMVSGVLEWYNAFPRDQLNHPGFRGELLTYLKKACEWGPGERQPWSLARELMHPEENINVRGSVYTKSLCAEKAYSLFIKKYRP